MEIRENMAWPPKTAASIKMAEHAAWYAGDPDLLANYYNEYLNDNFLNLPYVNKTEGFWQRQIKNQGETYVHVPIAGDIAETSANLLFGEAPIIRFEKQSKDEDLSEAQKELDTMLAKVSFNRKLIEGAEVCAGLGGVYIKLAWDKELSPYPIPVIHQPDRAIGDFKFGILNECIFWKVVSINESGSEVYRLLEKYTKGSIVSSLYKGTSDRIGKKVDLKSHPDTQGIEETVDTNGELLCVYVPNALPNRLDRTSNLGRSDYSGKEGLMDALDEAFTLWTREITLAQAKVYVPEQYMRLVNGKQSYNVDKQLYVKLDVDPVNDNQGITLQQFEIRSDQFEKTVLNLMERIITGAGYSPQTFGLAIQGRSESGLALQLRERKTFGTKSKKEKYWADAIESLVKKMCNVYAMLGGKITTDHEIVVSFSDGVMNNFQELATSVAQLSSAMAASTETKVRIMHPEWDEEDIISEVEKILEENGLGVAANPDNGFDNPDQAEMADEQQDE